MACATLRHIWWSLRWAWRQGPRGLEHEYFKARQGNAAPDRLLINAIGPQEQDVWKGREPALTIIPNLRMTSVVAMLVSAAVFAAARRALGTRPRHPAAARPSDAIAPLRRAVRLPSVLANIA